MEDSNDKKKKGKSDKSNDQADDEEEDIEVEGEMEDDDDGDNKKKKGKGKGKGKGKSKNPAKKFRLVKINKEKNIHEKDADTIDTYFARREFSNLTNMVSYFIQISNLFDIIIFSIILKNVHRSSYR